MTMKTLIPLAALALSGCALCRAPDYGVDPKDPVLGNWGLKLGYPDMNAGHLIASRDADGTAKALVLWRWASPMEMREVRISGNEISFVHPWGDMTFRGEISGNALKGTMTRKDGKPETTVEGWRNPVLEEASTREARFGEPIDLLKDGLGGWETMNAKAKFGWSIREEDGVKVLSNTLGLKPDGSWAGGGANLRTKRSDFYDFNLSYDVRVPKKSNSGVYLRGRYEIQVVDSFGKPVDRHNMAAYYGRVTPCKAVEREPGAWQHVDVTLYRRHLTVVLNGVTIIDNAPVVGVTGGAIDADEFVPGPIYLQGDHSDADFRNMILRKCL